MHKIQLGILSSLACLSLTGSPLLGQEGVWRPVTHRAGYESIDSSSGMMLGRPITGKSRVDQALEPASFGTDKQSGLPLPMAPATVGRFETLPPPQPGMVSYPPQTTIPSNTVPNANGANPNNLVPYPSGNVIRYSQGAPVIVGDTVVGNPVPGGTIVVDPGTGMVGGYPGMDICGISDRYYQQAIHGSPGIWYGSFDFAMFSLSKDNAPPLLVTGPSTLEAQNSNINSPGVKILYGNGALNNDPSYGGRVTMGVWFNRAQTWGMYGSFFTTGTQKDDFNASSDGSVFLARPYFNVSTVTPPDLTHPNGIPRTPSEDFERVAQTGLKGSVDINRTSLLRGADLNFRFNLMNNVPPTRRLFWNVDGYFGVKYLSLDESLTITERLESLANNPFGDPTGKKYFVQDSFNTRNNFYGGNLGLISEARLGRFFVETRTGIALGVNTQEVNINGVTTITPPNLPPMSFPGGLLAQPINNMGAHNTSQFGVVPEFGVKLGLQVTDHMRVYAGYDLLYWTNVVRPGQQIDYSVNPSQGNDYPSFQGASRPAFNFNTSNLWISSFSAGFSWVF